MEIKCQLDATEVFIADLIACSTCFGHHYAQHQELKSIIQWLLRVVFCAVVFKLLVWCGAEGYVSGLQDAALGGKTFQSNEEVHELVHNCLCKQPKELHSQGIQALVNTMETRLKMTKMYHTIKH